MKTTTAKTANNTKAAVHVHSLLLKAETSERILEAARTQWRLVKVEHKNARKAFKQAKKAARIDRKEAKAAAKDLRRQGVALRKPFKAVSLEKFLKDRGWKKNAAKSAAGKRNGHVAAIATAELRTPHSAPMQLHV